MGAAAWGDGASSGVLAAIGVVSLWTPLMSASIAARWFSWPNIALPGAGPDRSPR